MDIPPIRGARRGVTMRTFERAATVNIANASTSTNALPAMKLAPGRTRQSVPFASEARRITMSESSVAAREFSRSYGIVTVTGLVSRNLNGVT